MPLVDFGRATYSYLIPKGDLSLSDRAGMRAEADHDLVQKAVDLSIKTDPNDLLVRDTLPYTDLNMSDASAAHDESWILANAGVVGTDAVMFVNAIPQNKVVSFWGVSVEGPVNAVSRIKLGIGTGSALSTTLAIFQLEELYSALEPVGYFSQGIMFVQLDNAMGLVMPRIAFPAYQQRLALLARTCEPIMTLISRPSA